MRLVGIFGDIGKMETKCFAQTPELDAPVVSQTERECRLGDLLTII